MNNLYTTKNRHLMNQARNTLTSRQGLIHNILLGNLFVYLCFCIAFLSSPANAFEGPLLNKLRIYENDIGTCAFSGAISTQGTGWGQDGFIDSYQITDSQITYGIYSTEAFNSSISLRYANGAGQNLSAQVTSGGTASTSDIIFTATADWSTWANRSAGISLVEGYNTITVTATGPEGLPHIDGLIVNGNGNVNMGEHNCATQGSSSSVANHSVSSFSSVTSSPSSSATPSSSSEMPSSSSAQSSESTSSNSQTSSSASYTGELLNKLRIYENDIGTCAFSGAISTQGTGWGQDGFIDSYQITDSQITYGIYSTEAFNSSISLRYANGAGQNLSAQVTSGGTASTSDIIFTATADWSTWANRSAGISLVEGYNTITVTATGPEGLPHIDGLIVNGNGNVNMGEHNCSNFSFYDGFEAGNAGDLPDGWNSVLGWGQVNVAPTSTDAAVIDTTEAYKGSQSVIVKTSNQASPHFLIKDLPQNLESLYVRAYIKSPVQIGGGDEGSLGDHAHFLGLAAGGTGMDDKLRLGPLQRAYLGAYSTPDDAFTEQKPAHFIPASRWTCVEWGVEKSVAHDKMFAWLNGEQILAVSDAGDWPRVITSNFLDDISISAATFGWRKFGTGADVPHIWFDEIVISDQRIGCLTDDIVDHDNDGVVDTLDLCPDTPTTQVVNAEGCSFPPSAVGRGSKVIGAEYYSAASPAAPFEFDGRYMVWPGSGSIHLDVADDADGQLHYPIIATENSLSVHAWVNFTSSSDDSFFYKLEGVDSDWSLQSGGVTTGRTELHVATWTGLVVGDTYIFKIQRREDGTRLGSFRAEGGVFGSIEDSDGDGVVDGVDRCSSTPGVEEVNPLGCSPAQLNVDQNGTSQFCAENTQVYKDFSLGAYVPINANSTVSSYGVFYPWTGDDIVSLTVKGSRSSQGLWSILSVKDDYNSDLADNIYYQTTIDHEDFITYDFPVSAPFGGSVSFIHDSNVNNNYSANPLEFSELVIQPRNCFTGQSEDIDGDGISDIDDQCPNTHASQIADATGCAPYQKDSDNDGINDEFDQCTNTDPNQVVDGIGCVVWDADGDGIPDAFDLCPDSAATDGVESDGCQLDDTSVDNGIPTYTKNTLPSVITGPFNFDYTADVPPFNIGGVGPQSISGEITTTDLEFNPTNIVLIDLPTGEHHMVITLTVTPPDGRGGPGPAGSHDEIIFTKDFTVLRKPEILVANINTAPAALSCNTPFDVVWNELNVSEIRDIHEVDQRAVATNNDFGDSGWYRLTSSVDGNRAYIENQMSGKKYQYRIRSRYVHSDVYGPWSDYVESDVFYKPSCTALTDTSMFNREYNDGESEVLTLPKPNAAGISYLKLPSFNVVSRPLSIINLSTPAAKKIVIDTPSMRLKNHIKIVGETASLHLLNTSLNGAAANECVGCSFENVDRVTLATGALAQSITSQTETLGDFLIDNKSVFTVDGLTAPGVASIDVLTGRIDLPLVSALTTNIKVTEGATGYELDNDGDQVAASGSVSLFLGGLSVNLETLAINRAWAHNPDSPAITNPSTLNGTIESASIAIHSAEPLRLNAALSTEASALAFGGYQGRLFSPQEEILVQTYSVNGDVTIAGGLASAGNITVLSNGRLTIDSALNARSIYAAANGKLLVTGWGVVDAVAGAHVGGGTTENNGYIRAPKVEVESLFATYNRFGGRVFGNDVSLLSKHGFVRNGSLTPFRLEGNEANLSGTNTSQNRFGAYYLLENVNQSVARKVDDLSAQIVGDTVKVEAVNFENINPYYQTNINNEDWNAKASYPSYILKQVQVVGAQSLKIATLQGVRNTSAVITTLNKGSTLGISTAFIRNERYRVENGVLFDVDGETVHEDYEPYDEETGTGGYSVNAGDETDEYSTNALVDSPPGLIRAAGKFELSSSERTVNEFSYLGVGGDGDFISPIVKTVGAQRNAMSLSSIWVWGGTANLSSSEAWQYLNRSVTIGSRDALFSVDGDAFFSGEMIVVDIPSGDGTTTPKEVPSSFIVENVNVYETFVGESLKENTYNTSEGQVTWNGGTVNLGGKIRLTVDTVDYFDWSIEGIHTLPVNSSGKFYFNNNPENDIDHEFNGAVIDYETTECTADNECSSREGVMPLKLWLIMISDLILESVSSAWDEISNWFSEGAQQ